MRRLGFFLGFLFFFVPTLAHGDEAPLSPPPEPPPRSMNVALVEVNPLALLVNRTGANAQIAIVGPLALGVSASHKDAPGNQHYSEYEEGVIGSPYLRGWSYEIGPRIYFPGTRRIHAWVQPSFIHQSLHQGAFMECSGRNYDCTTGADSSVTRDGVALDVGVTFVMGPGFALSTGLGYSHTSSLRSGPTSSIVDFSSTFDERVASLPRLLLSAGWAF